MTKNSLKKANEGGRYEKKHSYLWGLLIFFLLIFIDQLTKLFADVYFSSAGAPDYIVIIPKGIIGLCIDYNPGIAFGKLSTAPPIVKIGLIVGTTVMMIVLFVLWIKIDNRRRLLSIALIFVIAGGVGNLIDRIYFRIWDETSVLGVRDMVQINFSPFFQDILHLNVDDRFFNFGICNFADFFITAGAVMLVLSFLFFDKDAFFPLGGYKALAKEAEEQEEKKHAEKQARKQAKKAAKKGN